jgi:transcriptional regulator with XRE-family HTH domain
MAESILDQVVQARSLASSGEARRIRVAARVSLTELADEVGVTAGAVSFWELSKRRPSGRLAVRYLKALNKLQARADTSVAA